jgi:hypothetical protein
MLARGTDTAVSRQATIVALLFAALAYAAGYSVLHFDALQHALNMPAWPVQCDFVLTVPAVYWWLHRRNARRALKGALLLAGLGVFMATRLIPDGGNGLLLDAASRLRNFGMLALVVFDIAVVISLLGSVRGLSQSPNPEDLLAEAIERRFGATPMARLLRLESRMWLYLLSPSRRPWQFRGDVHFSYHQKDASASGQLGWIYLMLASVPIDHFLIGLGSSKAAWVVTGLTLYCIAFQVAHYRATLRRPLSLDREMLYLRHGLLGDATIPLSWIVRVATHRGHVDRRQKGVLCFARDAFPNVVLEFAEPHDMPDFPRASKSVTRVYLGVDSPGSLVEALKSGMARQRDDIELRT